MEPATKIKELNTRLKKATGQVNKYAALSVKGKCTDEDWERCLEEWVDAADECFVFLLDQAIKTQNME